MSFVIDTNLLLRYFLDDYPKKAKAVEKLFKSQKELLIPVMVISEIVWVLQSQYKQPKSEIIQKLKSLLVLENVAIENKPLIAKAIDNFEKHNIDWIDSYLATYVQCGVCKKVYSFYKHFDRIKTVKRSEPK